MAIQRNVNLGLLQDHSSRLGYLIYRLSLPVFFLGAIWAGLAGYKSGGVNWGSWPAICAYIGLFYFVMGRVKIAYIKQQLEDYKNELLRKPESECTPMDLFMREQIRKFR